MAKVSRFTQDNQNPVGTIVQSMLTEAQFQSINGTSWVLADGRSVAGSRYATITGNSAIPDARGLFLRAAGDQTVTESGATVAYSVALGGKKVDRLQNITGRLGNHDTYGTWDETNNLPGNTFQRIDYAGSNIGYSSGANDNYAYYTFDASRQVRTSTETHPAHLGVNVFIKIN